MVAKSKEAAEAQAEAPEKGEKKKKANDKNIVKLAKLDIRRIAITVRGTSPLISNKFSQEALGMMRDKQQGKAKAKKKAKDPEADMRGSMHFTEKGKPGFPAVAFKAAAVEAARFVDYGRKFSMTSAKLMFHTVGDVLELMGEPEMYEAPVRNATGVCDIRYRAKFPEWGCRIVVEYNENAISRDQLVSLFEIAGFSCGVGAWRPSSKEAKNGTHGRFSVEAVEELD